MLFCISSLSAPSPRPLLFPPLRPRFSYQRLKAISFLKNAEAIFFVLFRAKIKFFSFFYFCFGLCIYPPPPSLSSPLHIFIFPSILQALPPSSTLPLQIGLGTVNFFLAVLLTVSYNR